MEQAEIDEYIEEYESTQEIENIRNMYGRREKSFKGNKHTISNRRITPNCLYTVEAKYKAYTEVFHFLAIRKRAFNAKLLGVDRKDLGFDRHDGVQSG